MPLAYQELRRMAQRYLRKQSAGHTFQTTELIHEAYLKPAAGEEKPDRTARIFSESRRKRYVIFRSITRVRNETENAAISARKITLEEHLIVTTTKPFERIVALDHALERLARLDERKAQVVEIKFFGGLITDEIAVVLKVSPETVKRDWSFSRIWLLREMSKTHK